MSTQSRHFHLHLLVLISNILGHGLLKNTSPVHLLIRLVCFRSRVVLLTLDRKAVSRVSEKEFKLKLIYIKSQPTAPWGYTTSIKTLLGSDEYADAPSLFGILFVAYSKLLSCFVDCFSPADLTTRLAYASVSLMQKQKHSKPKRKKKNLRVQKHEVHQTGWDSRVEKKSWKDINKTNAACWRVSNR